MAVTLDFHVAFGDNTDLGYGKTPDLDTQTWSLPASGSGCAMAPRVKRPQCQRGPWTLTWAQILGIHMVID